ncbi:HAMP domain-containing histidine kinase [bacterium]|nr:HAMP domain-containing histidine kinase [bacterium]
MSIKNFFKRGAQSSKKPLVIFCIIVVLLTAQIGWWMYFQIQQNNVLHGLHENILQIRGRQTLTEINQAYGSLVIQNIRHGFFGSPIIARHVPIEEISGTPAMPPIFLNGQWNSFYVTNGVIYYKDFDDRVYRTVVNWDLIQEFLGRGDETYLVGPTHDYTSGQFISGPSPWLILPVDIKVKSDVLSNLDSRSDRKTAMFVSEGVFFCILLLVGIYLMFLAFRREVLLQSYQKNFILSVTHEFKSPLASLKLYIQTLSSREVPLEKRKNFLIHSLHDVERLEKLVENVLEAARLDRDDYQYVMKPLDLSEVAQQSLKKIEHYANEETVQLDTDIHSSVVIKGDQHAIYSVFDNLIENAVKYSVTPKKISIKLYTLQRQAVFEIRDNGVGIEKKEMEWIFQKFYRVGNEMTRNTKGTGIGLFIVKKIVTRHKGDIRVHSDGLNQGTTFTVTFPLFNETKE